MGSSYSVVKYIQELDRIDAERAAKRAEQERLATSTAAPPSVVIADDANLSVNNNISTTLE